MEFETTWSPEKWESCSIDIVHGPRADRDGKLHRVQLAHRIRCEHPAAVVNSFSKLQPDPFAASRGKSLHTPEMFTFAMALAVEMSEHQGAFLKIDRLREPSPRAFQAWLKAIGETTLIDAVKAQRRQKRGGELQRIESNDSSATGSLIDLFDQLPDVGSTASRRMARSEAIAALQVAMSSLPQQQRCAIHLHLIQGKSLDETAAEMNRTPAAIRGLVHRGKQALSETMGRASMWLSQR